MANVKIALVAAFALLAFAVSSAYAIDCGANPAAYECVCGVGNIGNGATDFIGIAFAFVTVLIAAAYMYGKFVENERALVWAKDEAYNLLITALLFAGLAAFFTGSCSIAYHYNNDKNPFTASYTYLDTLIANGKGSLQQLMRWSIEDQKDATRYLNLGFTPFFGWGVATDANLRAQSSNMEFMVDMYLPLIASLSAQKQLLQVIEIVSAGVLLPFAFFLRIIPFTREFGNMLIALFFTLYIVVPTVYALSGAAFLSIRSNSPPVAYTIYDFQDFAFRDAQGADVQDLTLYKIGSTLPQAVFLPNLVLIIGITCMMSLSKALHAIQV